MATSTAEVQQTTTDLPVAEETTSTIGEAEKELLDAIRGAISAAASSSLATDTEDNNNDDDDDVEEQEEDTEDLEPATTTAVTETTTRKGRKRKRRNKNNKRFKFNSNNNNRPIFAPPPQPEPRQRLLLVDHHHHDLPAIAGNAARAASLAASRENNRNGALRAIIAGGEPWLASDVDVATNQVPGVDTSSLTQPTQATGLAPHSNPIVGYDARFNTTDGDAHVPPQPAAPVGEGGNSSSGSSSSSISSSSSSSHRTESKSFCCVATSDIGPASCRLPVGSKQEETYVTACVTVFSGQSNNRCLSSLLALSFVGTAVPIRKWPNVN